MPYPIVVLCFSVSSGLKYVVDRVVERCFELHLPLLPQILPHELGHDGQRSLAFSLRIGFFLAVVFYGCTDVGCCWVQTRGVAAMNKSQKIEDEDVRGTT